MSRYAKYSGATTLAPKAPEVPMRRFIPDFYNPPKDKPARNPKFGGVPRQPGDFGRRLPKKSPLRLPGFGGPLGLLVGYYGLNVGGYQGNPENRPDPRYFRRVEVCGDPLHPNHTHFGWNNVNAGHLICIYGQSTANVWPSLTTLPNWVTSLTLWDIYNTGGPDRGHMMEHWVRTRTGDTNSLPWKMYFPDELPDPNVLRDAPAMSPDPAGDYHGPSGVPPGGISTRPPRTGQRPRNPPKRTRERKAKGPIQTVLRVADFISESAELVGAFYDALPKKTKEKWGCNKLKRGLIDSAGQYGIDGADCKLQALWHNWHKVDIDQAIKNAIANEIQDRILGELQRRVPVNTGRTTDDAMKEINEWIGAFNEWLGL